LQLNHLSGSTPFNFFSSFTTFLTLILIFLIELKAVIEIFYRKDNDTLEKAYLTFSKYKNFLGVYDYSEAI
jgi:hypothetical protein